MRSYAQLTFEQRYRIQALLKMGHSYQEIGHKLGVFGYRQYTDNSFEAFRPTACTKLRAAPGQDWTEF